jgi:hypothetical protein
MTLFFAILIDLILVGLFLFFVILFLKFGFAKTVYKIGKAWLSVICSMVLGPWVAEQLQKLFLRRMITNAVHSTLSNLVNNNANEYRVIQIGEDDGIVNANAPYIYGSTHGVIAYYPENFKFYDGEIYGADKSSIKIASTNYGTEQDIKVPEGYSIKKMSLGDGREKAYLVEASVLLIEDDKLVNAYQTISEAVAAARTGNTNSSLIKVLKLKPLKLPATIPKLFL